MNEMINWNTVYEELTKGLVQYGQGVVNTPAGETRLREFNTIWMGSARQTGVTDWALKKLIFNSGAVIVVRNHNVAGMMLASNPEVGVEQILTYDEIQMDDFELDLEITHLFLDDYTLSGMTNLPKKLIDKLVDDVIIVKIR